MHLQYMRRDQLEDNLTKEELTVPIDKQRELEICLTAHLLLVLLDELVQV